MGKKIILIILIIFNYSANNIQAQIVLENNFKNEEIFRVKLEISGEKYVTFLPDSQKIKIYNVDKTLWRDFVFNIDISSEYEIYNLSQTLVNTDTLIEVTYGFRYSTSSGFNVNIKSETGVSLFSLDEVWSTHSFFNNGVEKLSFLKIGNESKLFVNTWNEPNNGFRVYSLPQLELEHTYSNLNFIEIENEGTKYAELVYNSEINLYTLNIYNLNHSIFKSIELNIESNVPQNYIGEYFVIKIIDVSKNKFNSDELIEVTLNLDYEDNSNIPLEKLIIGFNEIGNLSCNPLQLGNNGRGVIFKNINEYKMMCYSGSASAFPGNNNIVTANLFSLPDLQLVQSYSNAKSVIELDGIGSKLYEVNAQAGLIKFYNLNDSLWKTIQLPLPTSNTIIELFKISTTYFDNDTLIEVLYRSQLSNNGNINFKGNVYKEGSGIILEIDSCVYFSIDSIGGLQHKIIAAIATLDGSNYFGTKTFSWREGVNRFVGIDKISYSKQTTDFNFYPNPSSSNFTLNINQEKFISTKLEIQNLQGQIKLSTTIYSETSIIDISNLASGIYFVNLGGLTKKLIKH